MTNYITDKFNKFVFKTVKKLSTNDDLYDECIRVVEANKYCSELEQLVNTVAYTEIAYRFRVKKLEKCRETHGDIYFSYYDPMIDAVHQLGSARDVLMDYCLENNINYLEQLQ